jgi:sugar phosphate isomerase/epimerase
MNRSIASYSFHNLVKAGQHDMFAYITDSKRLGMSQLDPWVGHFGPIVENDRAIKAGGPPFRDTLNADEIAYLDRVKAAIDESGLVLGCIAVDGAHIYLDEAEARAGHRAVAYRWLDAARRLGAKQIRIDCGGSADMPDAQFDIIVAGYNDLMARKGGLDMLIENHFGASRVPANVERIFAAVPNLGLLMDTHNWDNGQHAEGSQAFAARTRSVHIKTFYGGDDDIAAMEQEVTVAVEALKAAGYAGCWGAESVARDGDDYAGIDKTFALMDRLLG